jgi:hypothetical protein
MKPIALSRRYPLGNVILGTCRSALAVSVTAALLAFAPHPAAAGEWTAEPCDPANANSQGIGCDKDPDLGWIKRGTKRSSSSSAPSSAPSRPLSAEELAEMNRRADERAKAVEKSIHRAILEVLPQDGRCDWMEKEERQFTKWSTTPEAVAEETKAYAAACLAGRSVLFPNERYGPNDDTCATAGRLYTLPPEFNAAADQTMAYEMYYLSCTYSPYCYQVQKCATYTRTEDTRAAIAAAKQKHALDPPAIPGPKHYKAGKSPEKNYKVNCQECHGADGQGTAKGLKLGVKPLQPYVYDPNVPRPWGNQIVTQTDLMCSSFGWNVDMYTGRRGHGLQQSGVMRLGECNDLANHILYGILARPR